MHARKYQTIVNSDEFDFLDNKNLAQVLVALSIKNDPTPPLITLGEIQRICMLCRAQDKTDAIVNLFLSMIM